MFICIKMDAECDETTPAILFDWFHEDFNNSLKKTSKSHKQMILDHHHDLWRVHNQCGLRRLNFI